MSVLALHQHADELGVRRYGVAATAIALVYAAVISAALVWYQRPQPAGTSLQPILVELAPAPAAQQLQTAEDSAPGPMLQQAEAPPPEPIKREVIEEQLQPTPQQPEATVAAPPKVETKVEPVKEKPQPVRDQSLVKKELRDQKTAARADRIGAEQRSPASSASAAAAAASYRSILASHLQRFKQYPADARARGEQGVASVTFTMTRDGRVTSSRLAKSSGHAALDRETVALVQRAQPLPAFPAEVTARSDTFTVPFSYAIR